jgi:hypothetical protein
LRRSIFALIVLSALLLPVSAQDPKPAETPAKQTPAKETKESPAKDNKSNPDVKFTAEQIVESVILLYGTRPGLDHIRRNGVERGKITRFTPDGNAEEADYERRFVRGENLDKDKIRLDQKMPTLEYSLIFGDGKLFGLINGAAFTPKQEAATSFISQHHHSIDSLLRYKECGSTLSVVGKDQQKGLDLFVVDLTDKEKRKTRFYISARSLRVLWLEYEEGPPGGTAVKYTKKFLDYRPVQQTLVPYRTLLYENGREAQEVRVLNITYGIKLNDSLFKTPEA